MPRRRFHLASTLAALACMAIEAPSARASDAMPPALAELHAAGGDCEAVEDLPDLEVQKIDLDEGRELWLVPCYSGAYRFAYAAYRTIGAAYERFRFADYSDHASWSVSDVIVNPEWNAETGVLTSYDMGRGLGDCGGRGEWRQVEGALRLERFFHKPECDGKGEPGVFPLVYEAKPVK